MRTNKLLIVLALIFAAGCAHPQLPPATQHSVVLTWNAPLPQGTWLGCGSGQPTCTYAIYRASGTTCPAATSTAWTEITNPASRPSALTFTDTSAAGLNACYAAYTYQTLNGSVTHSDPSNIAGPYAVPGVPIAPSLGTAPAISKVELPSGSEMAKLELEVQVR